MVAFILVNTYNWKELPLLAHHVRLNGLVGRDNTGQYFSLPIRYVGTIGGKLKVTQLSTTGYLLGQFDFCAIARMGNAEDAHYCQGS